MRTIRACSRRFKYFKDEQDNRITFSVEQATFIDALMFSRRISSSGSPEITARRNDDDRAITRGGRFRTGGEKIFRSN